jgi:putative hydrolase of the HAD superfamily
MLPKAILFDLDDTIISFEGASEPAWEKCCDIFINNVKTTFNSRTLFENINKVRRWYWSDPERHKIGRMNMIKARRDIVKKALEDLGYIDETNSYIMADNYSKLQEDLICLFPDSISCLENLKTLGIRLVLITNGTSEKQRGKINRFCLSDYFEFFLIEEEICCGKPDPYVYEIALDLLKLNANEVWMVGDNLVWDIEASQKVGIFAIWNDYNGKGLSKYSKIIPDRIISSISELLT